MSDYLHRVRQMAVRAFWILRHEGISIFVKKSTAALKRVLLPRNSRNYNSRNYRAWVSIYDTMSHKRRREIRSEIAGFRRKPLISVIMSLDVADPSYAQAAIRSLQLQIYPAWELCIACDALTAQRIAQCVSKFSLKDDRIRIAIDYENTDNSDRLNRAISSSSGEFFALMADHAELPEHALFYVARELLLHPNLDLIFSDEDKVCYNGKRIQPSFKPDWNPALMLSRNAFGNLGIYRKTLVERVGGFRPGLKHDSSYDLVLRCAESTQPNRIAHIPRILYHSRARRTGLMATVVRTTGSDRIDNTVPCPVPRVSILIPTTGNSGLLENCMKALMARTTYHNFEVLLLVSERDRNACHKVAFWDRLAAENRVRVLRYPDRPFNYSWVNNWGAKQASGELLCFLNDDTSVITHDWLERLVSRASLPGIAAVGPMLFYPDNTIQHAGVILGLSGVAGHACNGLPAGSRGYLGRACLEQDVSCVSAACMVMRSDVFRQVDGFDESWPVAYNDVDLCIRIRAAGWRIIWTPSVELYHHESASIGRHDSRENADQFASAVALMRSRWGPVLDNDPHYNPNLCLQRQFQLAFPPRHYPSG
jgi:O-antigen biosynthesis protein